MTGVLSWGIKQSFLEYIARDPQATIETGGGASHDDRGVFHFPEVSGSGAGDRRIEYHGDVLFTAHGGMLSVNLADPHIEFGPDSVVVTVRDPIDPDNARVDLVTVHLEDSLPQVGDGLETWNNVHTSLTAIGSELMGFVYPTATAFDCISFSHVQRH